MNRSVERLAPLIAMLPCLAVAVLYLQVLDHGYIDFDDMYYTYENPVVSQGLTWPGVVWAFSGSHVANYHPLTWISHMIDFSLFGNSPGTFALVNACLHAACASLVSVLIGGLFRSRIAGVFAGVVFAVHPQLVEAVAWISQRKTVLSTFFILLTWLLYLRSLRPDGRGVKATTYAAALVAFMLSLLAKGMFVTTPLILFLLELVAFGQTPGGPTSPGQDTRQRIRAAIVRLSPFLALSIAFSLVTLWAQAADHAVHDMESLPVAPRLATAVEGYITYVRHFIYPADLSIFYPRSDAIDPASLLSAIGLLTAISAALVFLRKSLGPMPLAGWLMFLVMLLPVIGIVQVGEQASADRYMYGPVIGLLVTLTALFQAATQRSSRRVLRGVLFAGAGLWTGFCALAAHHQVRLWHNSYSLALASEESVGPHPQVLAVQATILNRARRYAEAVPICRRGLALAPTHLSLLQNLAAAEWGTGNVAEAIAVSESLVRIAPDFTGGKINLAIYYANAGRIDEALRMIDSAQANDLTTVSERKLLVRMREELEKEKGKRLGASPSE